MYPYTNDLKTINETIKVKIGSKFAQVRIAEDMAFNVGFGEEAEPEEAAEWVSSSGSDDTFDNASMEEVISSRELWRRQ